MRLGEPGLGERVHRVLEFVALAHLRRHADLVQRLANERGLVHQPDEADVAGWLHVDLVECGREIVPAVARSELAERLGERHGTLAGLAETQHGVADLLDVPESDAASWWDAHGAALQRA